MTTNGYLLDRGSFAELLGLGVRRYQITLDGWAESHDRTRRRADGAGTFERIWSNLGALRSVAAEFEILIRVHVQPQTADSLDRLLVELCERFAGDARFDVVFFPVSNWGGPNAGSFPIFAARQGREIAHRLQGRWRGARSSAAEARTDAAEGPAADRPEPAICYAARPNSLLIRASGAIGKCTVLLNDERNRIGTLLPDGTVALLTHRLAPWLRGYRNLDEQALRCPARGLPVPSVP
jgi:uncharacterized protein